MRKKAVFAGLVVALVVFSHTQGFVHAVPSGSCPNSVAVNSTANRIYVANPKAGFQSFGIEHRIWAKGLGLQIHFGNDPTRWLPIFCAMG